MVGSVLLERESITDPLQTTAKKKKTVLAEEEATAAAHSEAARDQSRPGYEGPKTTSIFLHAITLTVRARSPSEMALWSMHTSGSQAFLTHPK